MLDKVREAQVRRDSLAASAGRTGARDSIGSADDLFSELDRMAEKIEGERSEAEAAEILDSLDIEERSEYHVEYDADEAPPKQELDVDAALAELKRRMEQE